MFECAAGLRKEMSQKQLALTSGLYTSYLRQMKFGGRKIPIRIYAALDC